MKQPSLLRINPWLYPASRADLENAYPETIFPEDLSGINLEPYRFAIPIATEPPVPGLNQEVREIDPVKIQGRYRQQWEVIDVPPPEPTPDWHSFRQGLRTNNGFPAAFGQLLMADAITATGLSARLDDWQNWGMMQPFLESIMQAATVMSPEDKTHLIDEMIKLSGECQMPTAFIEALQGLLS